MGRSVLKWRTRLANNNERVRHLKTDLARFVSQPPNISIFHELTYLRH